MSKSDLEQYKGYVSTRLSQIVPFLQEYAIGNFSKIMEIPEKEDEFTELLVGINLMIEDIQESIKIEADRSERFNIGMNEFIEGIMRVARGDYTVQFELSEKNDELDSLAMSINMMIDDIRTGIDNLRSSQRATLNIMEDLEGQRRELTRINEQLQMEIKERKKIEIELTKSEEKYRSLVERSRAGIAIADLNRDFSYVNETLCKMIGYTEEELIGTSFTDFIIPDDMEKIFVTFSRAFSNPKEEVELEFRVKHKDGHIVYLYTKPTVIWHNGEIAGFNAVITDITDHKRAEEAVKEKTKELERSNAELEQFAYVASHDLQEPLRMVSSYLGLLKRRYDNQLDSDAQDFIGFAVDGANRMRQLINDLLTYSRVQTRGKPFESTDCGSILERVETNLQIAIEESGAKVTHDPLPTVMADGSQLTQLFQNLVSNAIKFRGEEASNVHVSAKEIKNEWVFITKDNGIGIDPKHTERIFQIFQRLHGRDEYPGTGIGLAVCKKIVERHGGRIWVESEPGIGSTFYFTIPKKGGA